MLGGFPIYAVQNMENRLIWESAESQLITTNLFSSFSIFLPFCNLILSPSLYSGPTGSKLTEKSAVGFVAAAQSAVGYLFFRPAEAGLLQDWPATPTNKTPIHYLNQRTSFLQDAEKAPPSYPSKSFQKLQSRLLHKAQCSYIHFLLMQLPKSFFEDRKYLFE